METHTGEGIPAKRLSASHIDPSSIRQRRACGPGVELLIRERAPSAVDLPGGHREHLLMCTTGHVVPGEPVRSVLRTTSGERAWHECPRRQVSFIPAGLPLAWEWSYRSSSIHLALDPMLLDEIAVAGVGQANATALQPIFRAEDPTLRTLLDLLGEESSSHAAIGADLATSSLIMLISIRLHRLSQAKHLPNQALTATAASAGGLPSPIHERTLQLLQDRLSENISIADLAQDTGYSSWHFARLFRQSTGLPPHQYQLRLRIGRAKELLRVRPYLSVAHIACELGFADQSHLRRHFKRIVGLTPSAWRAQQSP
ncbi:MAG: AraC family transcriptional regulator [Pseudomonadota bacterium]